MTIVGRLMGWLRGEARPTREYDAVSLPPDYYDPRVAELARLEAENEALLALYGSARERLEREIDRELREGASMGRGGGQHVA